MDYRVFQALNSGSLRVQPSSAFSGEIAVTIQTPVGPQPFLFESGVQIDLLKAFTKEVLLANPHVLEMIGKTLQMV